MAIPEGKIEIVGPGDIIGDKARQLLEKDDVIHKAGFHTPRRVVLTQGFLEPMIDCVRSGQLTPKQQKVLAGVEESFGDTPLVIRSSAMGDARGTGIYRSEFTPNEPARVNQALLKVIESYYSESAIAFRKDSGSKEGFGVIIEPLIGQKLGDKYITSIFGPALSGFGYTSTSRENAFVVLVPGIGGGVDTRDGLKLTIDRALEHDRLPDSFYDHWFESSSRSSYYNSMRGIVENDQANLISYSSFHVNPLSLLNKIQALEQLAGSPQYLEWALTADPEVNTHWIVQIADANKKMDTFNFEDYGEILFEGVDVVGVGIKQCTKFVYANYFDNFDALHRFNQENSDYIAFLPASLSSPRHNDRRKLVYADFSNASVVLETSKGEGNGSLKDHLGTSMDLTDKFYAAIDGLSNRYYGNTESISKNLNRVAGLSRDVNGLGIIDGNFIVVASERQNRMIIGYLGPISDEASDDK